MSESASRDDERNDYADDRDDSVGLIDRLFLGIFSIYFIYLALVPCWWPFAPLTLGWAAVGLLVCQHPLARRKAIALFVIASAQMAIVGFVIVWMVVLNAR
jgi:hypothetical protein